MSSYWAEKTFSIVHNRRPEAASKRKQLRVFGKDRCEDDGNDVSKFEQSKISRFENRVSFSLTEPNLGLRVIGNLSGQDP